MPTMGAKRETPATSLAPRVASSFNFATTPHWHTSSMVPSPARHSCWIMDSDMRITVAPSGVSGVSGIKTPQITGTPPASAITVAIMGCLLSTKSVESESMRMEGSLRWCVCVCVCVCVLGCV